MNFPIYIARRYLFSKKSNNAINIISAISVCGVAITTMALVCTMSVFNGFQDLVATFFTAIDPELKVTPAIGKTMDANHPSLLKVKQLDCIDLCSNTLEDKALIIANKRQAMINIKGVDDHFEKATDLSRLLYGEGSFILHADVLEFGIPGIQLAAQLGLSTAFDQPIQVYAPRKGERINTANPMSGFNQDELYSPGVVFAVKQAKYDANYILTSIGFAQKLFDQKGKISALEIKLKKGESIAEAKEQIKELLGDDFDVKDRYEQQEDVFRIMEVEKLIAYLFLTFILLVACFNIIGSISMLMIEKKDDVQTLRHLGATDRQITGIFLFEGRMISTFGAMAGVVIGLILCYLQQTFGFITLGDSSGTFVIDAYPVSIHLTDVFFVFVTVLIVGYMAIWFPVRNLTKRLL